MDPSGLTTLPEVLIVQAAIQVLLTIELMGAATGLNLAKAKFGTSSELNAALLAIDSAQALMDVIEVAQLAYALVGATMLAWNLIRQFGRFRNFLTRVIYVPRLNTFEPAPPPPFGTPPPPPPGTIVNFVKTPIIKPYSVIRAENADLGIGGVVDAHHWLEHRFRWQVQSTGGPTRTWGSSAIQKFEHEEITQALRREIPYDGTPGAPVTTSTATKQQIWDAHKKVYTEFGYPDGLN